MYETIGDWMRKQLLNSVFTKYCDMSVPCKSIICFEQRSALANNLSRYWQITIICTTLFQLIVVTLLCFRRNNSKSSFGRSWKWEGCSICKCATITQFNCKGSKKSNSWGMEIVTSVLLTELVNMFQFYNMDLHHLEPTSQSDLTQRVAKEIISTPV